MILNVTCLGKKQFENTIFPQKINSYNFFQEESVYVEASGHKYGLTLGADKQHAFKVNVIVVGMTNKCWINLER